MFTQSNSIQTIKENIMTYFNGTLQEFTYLHEQVTEISNPDQDGIHILTFLKNDPEHFDDDDTASITCIECLRDTFAYDPEACFGQAPIITEFNSFFTVSIPYNY